MSDYQSLPDSLNWSCAKCGVKLAPAQVMIRYLGNAFPVELLACPQCGQVLIPEGLAIGKIAEVEQTLEDK